MARGLGAPCCLINLILIAMCVCVCAYMYIIILFKDLWQSCDLKVKTLKTLSSMWLVTCGL